VIGDLHVVSVSGGKDSTATSLHLRELGIEHRRVFADTGWELPETYDYIEKVLVPRLGPIDVVRGPKLMEELIHSKQMFPSRRRRYCTEQLKFLPIKRYLHALAEREDVDIVNVIGIRGGESKRRSKLPEREFDSGMGLDVWRPLIAWTLDDVLVLHRRHDMPLNPLYLQGFTRVGCAPCIMSRKEEIRMLAEKHPEQIDKIRVLEANFTHQGKEGFFGGPRAFFQAPLKNSEGKYPAWPIDKIVEWSKTSRGGRQMFLIRPEVDPCSKWGFCDWSEDGDISDDGACFSGSGGGDG